MYQVVVTVMKVDHPNELSYRPYEYSVEAWDPYIPYGSTLLTLCTREVGDRGIGVMIRNSLRLDCATDALVGR